MPRLLPVIPTPSQANARAPFRVLITPITLPLPFQSPVPLPNGDSIDNPPLTISCLGTKNKPPIASGTIRVTT